jgi:transposase
VIEGVAYKYRVGMAWREVPERFGPWQTFYERLWR